MAISTMYPGMNNSPSTSLSSAITASATSITLKDSSVLPAAPNLAVIGNTTEAEIISYNVKNGNTLTGVVRGLAGTVKKAWSANTVVARNFTMYDYKTLCDNITALDTEKQDASSLKALAFKDKAVLTSDVSGVSSGSSSASK